MGRPSAVQFRECPKPELSINSLVHSPIFPGFSGGSGSGTHAIWQMNFPANKQLCCSRTARTSQSPPAALFQVRAGQSWHRNESQRLRILCTLENNNGNVIYF